MKSTLFSNRIRFYNINEPVVLFLSRSNLWNNIQEGSAEVNFSDTDTFTGRPVGKHQNLMVPTIGLGAFDEISFN